MTTASWSASASGSLTASAALSLPADRGPRPWCDGARVGWELRIGELGERHEERAAAAALGLHLLGGRSNSARMRSRGGPMRRGGRGQPLPVEAVGALDDAAIEVVLGGKSRYSVAGATSASAPMASTPWRGSGQWKSAATARTVARRRPCVSGACRWRAACLERGGSGMIGIVPYQQQGEGSTMILVTGATGNVGARSCRTVTPASRARAARSDRTEPAGRRRGGHGDLEPPRQPVRRPGRRPRVFLLPGYEDMAGSSPRSAKPASSGSCCVERLGRAAAT